MIRPRTSSLRRERTIWLLIFLLPAMGLVVIFTLLPALSALAYSLYNWTSFNRGEFVGLENFRRLFNFPFDQTFINALWHNTIAFVGLMIVQNAVGLFLAYALWRQPPGFKFFRAVVFLPVIFSLVVVGFLWKLLLDPLIGPVTKVAFAFGADSFAPLGDSRYALYSLILINAWRWVGFPTLVFLAGMNSIPDDYYEAARLDGANEAQMFFSITVPLLGPSVTTITVLTFIGAMEWFELPYIMTGVTALAGATDTMVMMFYRLAFGGVGDTATDVGLASAVCVILFVIVGIGSAASALYLRRREVEM
jgi:raffinose/stachyose/melibiose transport system permease protein